MNSKLYWKQKLPVMLLNCFCMIGLAVFLRVTANSFDSIFLILLIWIVILTVHLVISYHNRKVQMEKLLDLAEQLEERYLLSEVMGKPERADDRVYCQLLRMAGKSMLEQVNEVRRERTEYKEYVEQWVHEVKMPITAMKLLCENNRSQVTKELLTQLEKVNRYTEQALYYARSEHTEKDYSVREIRLFDVVHQSIAENKYLLLQNGVGIELQFYIERQGNQVILCVEDNGIGIDAGDLQRIFEKGFTGQNGRKVLQNSTGIGLYLCRRLCNKLGIGICADSKGSGTTLRLIFHINDFIERV